MRIALTIAVLALALAACGCKNKGKNGGGGTVGGGGGDPAACDAQAEKVEGLYAEAATAAAKPDDKPETVQLRAQEVRDNTAMVLADCRKAPARFAPCLEKATSVEQLERDCLIAIDDAGKVEGDYFRKH